ncbi:hypothetical protein H1Q63_00720 [Desmonostoc muscorum CCALA 125]|nr:hypothetical protein [Desmonostoc muscorum CCALA 125]
MGIEEWGRRKACGIATLNAQRLVLIYYENLLLLFAKIFGQEKDYLKYFTIRDRSR